MRPFTNDDDSSDKCIYSKIYKKGQENKAKNYAIEEEMKRRRRKSKK